MGEEHIGQIILKLRLLQNLTREELSCKANVSRSQIYYIETGKRKATFETVNKVILALGFDIIALLEMQSKAII